LKAPIPGIVIALVFIRMKKKQVLIVDDDVSSAETLAEFLTSKQWECVVFSEAKQALNYHGNKPSAVVVDFELPDMYGTELLGELLDRCNGSVGIIVSANPSWEIRQKALESGASYFFPKPIDLLLLLEKINQGSCKIRN